MDEVKKQTQEQAIMSELVLAVKQITEIIGNHGNLFKLCHERLLKLEQKETK